MPSYLHEGVLELFRADPSLAATLIARECGVLLPDSTGAKAEACDFTDMGPKEYRGDLAFGMRGDSGEYVLGICVEVQLAIKRDRAWSWPVYLATLRSRLRCPVLLLVVAPNQQVAEWAGAPIELGHPGLTLRPLVLGPGNMPLVTDPIEAQSSPERAVLSAMTYGSGPHMEEVLQSFLAGLMKTDDERARMYHDLVDDVLSEAASRRLEELMTMTYEYRGRIARKYVEEGWQEGHEEGLAEAARVVLTVLDARGVVLSEGQRVRIEGCRDVGQLEDWARRAATITTADELFD
ncbi:hypothetical protein [Nocardia amikacinitolerans]|uniref:hypothetical protein n=1 Tax=Nocardia amikacinitolerans TaxID=756689 RepID=UPI0020A36595|nr:hypothetical protein [Nocardia amikacinitolerans]MCP2292362.1 hypothetical protein [Nocardia amikacinitolerans]